MLSKRLKELRMNNGLKQSDLAKLLSISTSRYGQYETGRRSPDYKLLIQIANFYNVSIDYLLGRTNVIKPENIDENDLLAKLNTADSETKASVEQFLNYLLYEKERKHKEKNDNNAKKNTDNEIAI
ncbi:MAG: helix-turn-helix transcriptional regulator [Megamonas funiformis]|jgi:transcriptional regulator with XRE-family HTH domain|uniref:helix-turn-helix domain-containing protein n=1 Tax=Megamonas funiformis TaxID=437897 RepID=UPI00266F896A|nr:helix-turn-helix transcriptional regulator [Megamonas funiformis]MDY3874997.1 helix-turn-helix transcriptional regulator [Megamonas funiformis]